MLKILQEPTCKSEKITRHKYKEFVEFFLINLNLKYI